jgi:ELWxxDGT repeat protein
VLFNVNVSNGVITNNELWATDLTDAGTVQLKGDFLSFFSPQTYQQLDQFGAPQSERTFNGNLLFLNEARGANTGSELWRTDGTVGGTALVKDVNPGTFLSNITNFIPFGSTFLFRATDQANGTELWSTDVTTAGTNLVKDIFPGSTGSGFPSFLQVNDGLNVNQPKSGNTVFFQATDGTTGTELWKSDGTAAGTVLVRDINAGTFSSNPQNLHMLGGALFFAATTQAEGQELWRTDGTAAGTTLVKDIFAGSTGSSSPQTFNLLGGRLVFTATDAAAGREVWATDGTNAGTVLLKDLDAGTSNSNPSLGTNFGRQAIGSAFSTATGNEVVASDGTAAGTTITDVNPGTFVSGASPASGTVAANRLFFTATTQAAGTELHALSLAEVADPPTITSFLNKGGAIGTPFSYQILATGNKNLAIVKMASNLPPGLTFSTSEKNKGYVGFSSSGRTGDGFILGTPTTPGIFNVTLTADNGAGVTTRTLLIIIPGKGTSSSDIDSDEDGFPDELEIFLGTDPNDPNSTPTGGSKADKTSTFTVDRLQISLDFNTTGRDAFAVSGTVPTGTGFSFAGQRFVIGIGGVYKLFTLDEKGKARSADKKDQVVVGKPGKTGTSKYAAKGTKQTFSKTLEDEGLENVDAKDQAVKVPVIVLFNNKLFIKKQDQLFNLKKGKGKTKLPRR